MHACMNTHTHTHTHTHTQVCDRDQETDLQPLLEPNVYFSLRIHFLPRNVYAYTARLPPAGGACVWARVRACVRVHMFILR